MHRAGPAILRDGLPVVLEVVGVARHHHMHVVLAQELVEGGERRVVARLIESACKRWMTEQRQHDLAVRIGRARRAAM